MGKKLSESSPEPEPTVPRTLTNSEHKPHKKKKNKNKHKDEDGSGTGSSSHKRRHVETEEVVEEAKKGKEEEKKKKKNKEREANGAGENGKIDEEVRDGNVVVSGKGVKDDKYKPVESFGDSKLPEEVIECCKGFKKPSPIQSRAWPFLLDGRDFIGIAATGSGTSFDFVRVFLGVFMCFGYGNSYYCVFYTLIYVEY